jgi:hypothetical protein
VVAISETAVALASWADQSILVFNLENEELIQRISPLKAVGLAFTETALVALEHRDRCLFGDLESFTKPTTLHCEGLHSSLIPTGNGSFLVSGERPILIQDRVVKGIEYHGFTAGAACDDRYAIVSHERLAIVIPDDFVISVQHDLNSLNVIDAIQVEDNEKFVVVTAHDNQIQLGISAHPLARPQFVVNKPIRDKYSGIASISFEDQRFVGVLLGQSLTLYEFSDQLLEIRSHLVLDKVPLAIESFQHRFLVAFPEKVELYQTMVVSASDVRLRKICEMPTQGSASCVTCDNEIIVIVDDLQSVVLYDFSDSTNKFGENARNTFEYWNAFMCKCVATITLRSTIQGPSFKCRSARLRIWRAPI